MYFKVTVLFLLQSGLIKLLSSEYVHSNLQPQQLSNLSIYLVTYNVGGQSPSEDLSGLFDHFRELHDIYVIALEELPTTIIVTGVDKYMKNLDRIFQEKGFIRLQKKRMTVTALYVYVPGREVGVFRDVAKASIAFDWKKLKGGLAIRLSYQGTSMAFVGAHFYAFDGNIEERIQNYQQVIREINFSAGAKDGILEQDIAFFMGDLNSRIDGLSTNKIEHLIQNSDWTKLIEHDQLNFAKSQGRAFQEFCESRINFGPTYKFHVQTRDSYNLKRKPAYTDRILYRSNLFSAVSEAKLDSIKVFNYTSLLEFKASDHKPVCAVVRISSSMFTHEDN